MTSKVIRPQTKESIKSIESKIYTKPDPSKLPAKNKYFISRLLPSISEVIKLSKDLKNLKNAVKSISKVKILIDITDLAAKIRKLEDDLYQSQLQLEIEYQDLDTSIFQDDEKLFIKRFFNNSPGWDSF